MPTKSILPVLGALFCDVPQGGDAQGQAEHLLQRYLWRAFFTERFMIRRAELVVKAARLLEQGHQVSAANVVGA